MTTAHQYPIVTCYHAARRGAALKNQAVGSVLAKRDHSSAVTAEYRLCNACFQLAVSRFSMLLGPPAP